MKLIRLLLTNLLFIFLLSSCSLNHPAPDGPPPYPVDVKKIHDPTPKYEPKSRYGNSRSYVALGKRYYVLSSAEGYDRRGLASWYGMKFDGKMTANRERYDLLGMTAASPELPIPCYARITNLENGYSVIVRVNDRGPFVPHRILDLSYAAAKKLGFANKGTAWVEVKTISPRPPSHSFYSHYAKSHSTSLHYIAYHGSHRLHSTAHHSKRHSQPPKGHRIYLQVGAFSNLNRALFLKHRLTPWVHYPVRIVSRPTRSSHALYRVRIGPLPNSRLSKQLLTKLHQHGIHTAFTVIS